MEYYAMIKLAFAFLQVHCAHKSYTTIMMLLSLDIKASNECTLPYTNTSTGPECTTTSNNTSNHATHVNKSKPANNYQLAYYNHSKFQTDLGNKYQWTSSRNYLARE